MHDEIIQLYEQILPFWAEVCGPGTEICLYDLSDPEHALAGVWNPRPGHRPGSALPPALREMAEAGFSSPEGRLLPVPDEERNPDLSCRVCPLGPPEKPLGLLCVTKDLRSARELAGAIHSVLERFALEPPRSQQSAADTTVTRLMQDRIAAMIGEYGIPPARMTVQEKVEVVHRLSDAGLMNMKGAVGEIASQLCVSVPTVYRYLNKKDHP